MNKTLPRIIVVEVKSDDLTADKLSYGRKCGHLCPIALAAGRLERDYDEKFVASVDLSGEFIETYKNDSAGVYARRVDKDRKVEPKTFVFVKFGI